MACPVLLLGLRADLLLPSRCSPQAIAVLCIAESSDKHATETPTRPAIRRQGTPRRHKTLWTEISTGSAFNSFASNQSRLPYHYSSFSRLDFDDEARLLYPELKVSNSATDRLQQRAYEIPLSLQLSHTILPQQFNILRLCCPLALD